MQFYGNKLHQIKQSPYIVLIVQSNFTMTNKFVPFLNQLDIYTLMLSHNRVRKFIWLQILILKKYKFHSLIHCCTNTLWSSLHLITFNCSQVYTLITFWVEIASLHYLHILLYIFWFWHQSCVLCKSRVYNPINTSIIHPLVYKIIGTIVTSSK